VDASPRRRGPWRALGFAGGLALVVGLAFLVARPRGGAPAESPYAGARGASRGQAAGMQILVRRGGELRALQPGTPLHAGDVLRFVVRGERERYVVVRMRDAGGPASTLFPAAGQAASVSPGATLPIAPTIGPEAGKVALTALFADHPFPVDAAPGPDTEVISLVLEKAP
jgi:hypothetical protein